MRLTKEPMEYGDYLKFGYKCGLEPFTYEGHIISCIGGFGYNFYHNNLTAYFMVRDRIIFIAGIVVDEPDKRKGYLKNFIKFLKLKFNPTKICFATSIDNVAMINFADNYGFVKVDMFKDIKDAYYYEHTCS